MDNLLVVTSDAGSLCLPSGVILSKAQQLQTLSGVHELYTEADTDDLFVTVLISGTQTTKQVRVRLE